MIDLKLKKINDARKFLFVNLCLEVRVKGVNHGIAALVPLLRKKNYSVEILNLNEKVSISDFIKKIEFSSPSILGFSFTSHQLKSFRYYSKALKSYKNILILAGGIHPTLDPEGTFRDSPIDGICIGEGERPLAELLERIDNKRSILDIKGFQWRFGNKIIFNYCADYVMDINSLPFPDYTLYDKKDVVRDYSVDRSLYYDKSQIRKFIEVMISRGCPYDCNYCCNQSLRKLYRNEKGYFRLPAIEWSINFLKNLREHFPETEYIEFIDDLLLANKNWFLEWVKKYKKEIQLPYRICARFELIDEQILNGLKESGCSRLMFGLESGDEELRSKLLNRHCSNETIIDKCRLIRKYGIPIMTLNIIGFPFEKRQQMLKTLDLNKKIKPEFGTCFFFRPYLGTKLYDVCEERGLLLDNVMYEVTSNYTRPLIKIEDISIKEAINIQKRFAFYFYYRTFLYRCREFLSKQQGIKKVLIIIVIGKLILKGAKLYIVDYFGKKY